MRLAGRGRRRPESFSDAATCRYSVSIDQRRLAGARHAGDAGDAGRAGISTRHVAAGCCRSRRRSRSARAGVAPACARRAPRCAAGRTGTAPVSESARRLDVRRRALGDDRGRRARRRPARGRRRGRPAGWRPRRARRRSPCCRGRAGGCSVSSSRWLSRWCSPIDGSSRMYITPTSPEPIWLASRMRCASPPESVSALRSSGEVVEADVDEEREAVGDLLDHLGRDLAAPAGEPELAKNQAQRPADGQRRHVAAGCGRRRTRGARRGVRRAAARSRGRCACPGTAPVPRARSRTRSRGSGARGSAGCPRSGACASRCRRARRSSGTRLARRRCRTAGPRGRRAGSSVHGRLDVEAVVLRERLDQLEVVGVAAVPAAHRAAGERQRRVRHDARRDRRTACTPRPSQVRAGADRVVEREQPRLELGERCSRRPCRRSGSRTRAALALGLVHERDARHALARPARSRTTPPAAGCSVRAHLEAVDDDFDRVLAAQVERRRRVELDDLAVDARAHEAPGRAGRSSDLRRARPCGPASTGASSSSGRALRQREHLVDHLADGLRREVEAVLGAARACRRARTAGAGSRRSR